MKTKGTIEFKSSRVKINFVLMKSDGEYSIIFYFDIMSPTFSKKLNKNEYDDFMKKYVDDKEKEDCEPIEFLNRFNGLIAGDAEWVSYPS